MNLLKKLGLSRILLTSFLIIVIIFSVISYLTFINVNKLVQTTDIEEHTVEVLEHLSHILSDLSDAETGQRGYLLTGGLKYLEPYNSGISSVGEEINEVEQLTVDNPAQQERIVLLKDLVKQKENELRETVSLKSEGKSEEAIAIVLSDRGKDIMDNIRFLILDMQEEEERLLEIRKIATSGAEKNTQTIILFGSLAGLLTAVYLALVISRHIGSSIETIRHIASEIAKGNMDIPVDTTGTNELAQLSDSINTMRVNLKKSLEGIKKRGKQLDIQLQKTDDARMATGNVLEDVEEEKRNVSQEKDKIDAILHGIGDGVFVLDNDFRIFIFNKSATRISGFNDTQVLGEVYDDIIKFVYEKDGTDRGNFVKDSMKRGEIRELLLYSALVRKNGDLRAVSATAAPLKDRNEKVIGCVVVFHDIEKEREIDKSKSEFVSLASHQLRTPLSTINWYTEMILDGDIGEINDEQRKHIDQIYSSNKRMVDLVNALLNVSRLELGTFIVEPKLLDITKIAKDSISEMASLLKERNIEIVEEYDDLPKVNLDKKLTHIIFQNLLSNAVKYSPAGSTVNLNILKSEHDVNIEVVDSGMGIPKDQQDKMFTKLFRADNVKNSDTNGTGLGLYIVKSILDHSGGKVSFESEEGKGTTFRVSIPLSGMSKKTGTKSLS